MNESNKNILYILLFFAMIGWGASWVHAKVLSSYINEFELILFRNIFTIITLVPVIFIAKKSFRINKKDFILALLASIIMIAYLKYYFLGTKFGTASLGGALVTSMIPIITFIFMALFFKRKIQKKDAFALTLGAIGVMTILHVWTFSLKDIFAIHNIYFIYAALLWPILTIVSSKTTKTSALTFTLYIYLISTLLVSVFFIDIQKINYESFDDIFWFNILSLAVLSTTFATSMYFYGIEKLGAAEVSSFIFIVPFAAILLSYLFLGEDISLSIIIGTILTLLGVKILNNIKISKKLNF